MMQLSMAKPELNMTRIYIIISTLESVQYTRRTLTFGELFKKMDYVLIAGWLLKVLGIITSIILFILKPLDFTASMLVLLKKRL